jgi:hypothetical protein
MIGHPGLLFVVKITELPDFPLTGEKCLSKFPLTGKNTGEIRDIPMFPGLPIAAITSIDSPPDDFPRSAKFIRNREKQGKWRGIAVIAVIHGKPGQVGKPDPQPRRTKRTTKEVAEPNCLS